MSVLSVLRKEKDAFLRAYIQDGPIKLGNPEVLKEEARFARLLTPDDSEENIIPRARASGWYTKQNQWAKESNAESSENTLDRELEAAWDIINTEHTWGDQTKKSPHFIDLDHPYQHILAGLEQNANDYFERDAAAEGDAPRDPFAFKDYQRDGIGMAANLERTKGGCIIGDDMGLGKTAQLCALCAVNPVSDPIIIVAPASTIDQWVQEIRKILGWSVDDGQVIVYVGHLGVSELQKAKIVLTSYDRLRSEYEAKEKHRKDCWEHQRNPWAVDRKDDRFKDPSELAQVGMAEFDIEKIEAPRIPISTVRPHCPLFSVKWGRVVLEEGHAIRNTRTKNCRAALDLDARYRDVLTGTPFANEYTDLQAYFRFLRISPFSDPMFYLPYFINVKKNSENERNEIDVLRGTRSAVLHLALKSIMVRRLKENKFENKPILSIPEPKNITRSVTLDNGTKYALEYEQPLPDVGEYNFAAQMESCDTYLRFQQKEVGWQELEETTIEFERYDRFYPATEQQCQYESRSQYDNSFRQFMKQKGKKARLGPRLFPAMLFATLAAFHPATVHSHYAFNNEESKGNLGSLNEEERVAEAALAMGTEQVQRTRRATFRAWMEVGDRWKSSKVEMCLADVEQELGTREGKVLIFSPFLSCLDVMDVALKKAKSPIETVRFDGSLKPAEKAEALKSFRSPQGPRVMLITSGAGGEGLNLQGGTSVFFLNPHWTPMREIQALCRAYRLGQKETVHIYRYEVQNSMECRYRERNEIKKAKLENLMELNTYSMPSNEEDESRKRDKSAVKKKMVEIRGWSVEKFLSEMQMHKARIEKEDAKNSDRDYDSDEDGYESEPGEVSGIEDDEDDEFMGAAYVPDGNDSDGEWLPQTGGHSKKRKEGFARKSQGPSSRKRVKRGRKE